MFFTELIIGLSALILFGWLLMHALRFYKGVRVEDLLEGKRSRFLKQAKVIVPIIILFLIAMVINASSRLIDLVF